MPLHLLHPILHTYVVNFMLLICKKISCHLLGNKVAVHPASCNKRSGEAQCAAKRSGMMWFCRRSRHIQSIAQKNQALAAQRPSLNNPGARGTYSRLPKTTRRLWHIDHCPIIPTLAAHSVAYCPHPNPKTNRNVNLLHI